MIKKISLVCFVLFAVMACKNNKEENKVVLDEGAYARSSGRPNTLTIVMDNRFWEGGIGEVLRKNLAAAVPGLPQEEPMFTIRQMPSTAFTGFANKSRCFLKIVNNKEVGFKILKNKYARPQIGIVISGRTDEEIINTFRTHKAEIIQTFKAVEILNKQQLVKTPLVIKGLDTNLGISLSAPKSYRVAKASKDFYWIRKNISHGTMNITAYEVPLNFFKDSLSITQNIISMRDTYGGDNIVVDEGGRFITEAAYSPYIKEINMANFDTYETRGTWEVKNKWMAGPFVNYVIKDTKKNRLLVLEGFVFAPSINKRDYVFELEAILKTVKFID
ncbi:DUF4837 family protein [Aquimarina agarilytica]|uniref:DUF4837 family protein n=1 Tax=Aquimarina agarilytica TaxID=1087449 RepID=UPI000288F174|nr:DUF4837 family protein [Aquimarina agarilytica]